MKTTHKNLTEIILAGTTNNEKLFIELDKNTGHNYHLYIIKIKKQVKNKIIVIDLVINFYAPFDKRLKNLLNFIHYPTFHNRLEVENDNKKYGILACNRFVKYSINGWTILKKRI